MTVETVDTIPAPSGLPYADTEPAQSNPHKIPAFEGQAVEFTKAKLTSVSALEIDDAVFSMDSFVRMTVEARVVRVDHVVNDKTGKLERVHTFKAIDATIVDWDNA